MIAVVDVDDLISEDQIIEYLVPIKKKVPDFQLTCYTVPNKFGPVSPNLRERYPWIEFGIHGFEHTPFECLTWSDDQAMRIIKEARAMGYHNIFKPPNWTLHEEIVDACKFTETILHHHDKEQYKLAGLWCFPGPIPRPRAYAPLHTHILKNPVTDHITNHPGFLPENLVMYEAFSKVSAYARKM